MIEVRPGAISANVASLVDRLAMPVMGVVKANGYGHGALVAARAMLDGGATWLGVVDIAEARALRDAGIRAPILAWLHAADADFGAAAEARIDVGVSSVRQLEAAARAGAIVHAKVDTGLGRNGVPFREWDAFVERAEELVADGLTVRGIFSHIAGSGAAFDGGQIERYRSALERASALGASVRHLGASAASLFLPASRFDLARIGIAAYGIHPEANAPGAPADGSDARALGLVPAMRMAATAHAGVVDVGFRDGLLPAIGAPVLVAGRVRRVATMAPDSLTLDEPCDGEAVLFGDPAAGEPSVDAWARAAGTIGYEVVTRMASRAPRSIA